MRSPAFCLVLVALACGSDPAPTGFGAVGGSTGVGGVGFGGTGPVPPAIPTELFEGRSQSSERAAPFIGGTLLVTRDDTTAVAADPDRDRVSFVTLRTLQVQSVELAEGTMPGRVVETSNGRIAVLSHGTGSVLLLDVGGTEPVFQRPVCAEPRGLAYDAVSNALLVACRSGQLVRLDAGSGNELSRVDYDDDLVDVTMRGREVVLTRERSVEHLVLDEAGRVVRRAAPGQQVSVAFRSLALPNGEVLTAHQHTQPEMDTSYGFFGDKCGPMALMTGLSMTQPPPSDARPPPKDPRDTPVTGTLNFDSNFLAGFVGPIDMSISGDATKLALLAVGNGFGQDFGLGSLMLVPLDPERGSLQADIPPIFAACQLLRLERPAGEPIAVALNRRGRAFVQSREPAALVLENGLQISLGAESRADTGLALFYMNANTGVSCASCHPGGLEDGRNWFMLEPNGHKVPRRTQALAGGLRALAPYHWSGEFPTFTDLVSGVMLGRMMAPIPPTPEQTDALLTWLDGIPMPSSTEGLDAAAVARGKAAFFDAEVGCSGCHGGGRFTDNLVHDVGTGGRFYSPSLIGVGNRAPYFHDGCATDLSRVLGVCGGVEHDVRLDPADADDLVQYLRSL